MKTHLFAFGLWLLCASVPAADAPAGWSTASPREEITPAFRFEAQGGPAHNGSWVIESDAREGLIGRWTKTFPVKGGQYYQFRALRRIKGADSPRRAAVARVLWRCLHTSAELGIPTKTL